MPALAEPVALENAPSTLNLMAVRARVGLAVNSYIRKGITYKGSVLSVSPR